MEGSKQAFCMLLWINNGGTVNHRGQPLATGPGRVTGNCTTPFDCYSCALMQQELINLNKAGKQTIWVCPSCLDEVIKQMKNNSQFFHLPGHFTEGQCQYDLCQRTERLEGADIIPSKYSRFLQLLIYEELRGVQAPV